MTDRISAAQLAEIEKRANDATNEPWRYTDDAQDWQFSAPRSQHGRPVMSNLHSTKGLRPNEADALFIIHARSDVPALVNEIRAAWGEAEAATRALRRLFDARDGDAWVPSLEDGEAPGHAHSEPGVWDDSGDACEWCAAWTAARALVGSENRNEADE